MKQKIKIIIILNIVMFSAFLLSGCATILKGGSEQIFISSQPAGAVVEINGKDRGKTPLSLDLETDNDYQVNLKKEGFEDYEILLKSEIDGSWVVIDIICAIVPLSVDAVTGNWKTLDQKIIDVQLVKREKIERPQ